MDREFGMEVNLKEIGIVAGLAGTLWAYCRWLIGVHLVPLKDVTKDLKLQTRDQWTAIEQNKDGTHAVSERVTALEATLKTKE